MYKETLTFVVDEIPAPRNDSALTILRSNLLRAIKSFLEEEFKVDIERFSSKAFGEPQPAAANNSTASANSSNQPKGRGRERDEDETKSFEKELKTPKYRFDQLVLEKGTMDELEYSIKLDSVKDLVYTTWGLQEIEPEPKSVLNFWGDSGTGKTMAAHAIASKMDKKIILASYADIESKYHGDGPKNVKRLFEFAKEKEAVLFIDEADSLLSKRLTNVTQGSEQAINSMRSQLLIQIQEFSGVVIFATNLASNYDSAFLTRIKSIHFKKPTAELRQKLWEKMLLPTLPLEPGATAAHLAQKLSQIENVCGRDIKNAVVQAAIKTAVNGERVITYDALERSMKDIIESNEKIEEEKRKSMMESNWKKIGRPLSEEEKKRTQEIINNTLAEEKEGAPV